MKKDLETFTNEQDSKHEAAIIAGETYEKEVKELEQVNCSPFNSTQSKFVVCIDTMGQDCEISDEHRRFVLKTVQAFREQWERAEEECLTQDRDRKIELINRDPQIELDLKEKVEELVAQAVEKALAVEEPAEGVVV